jgi:hypothetical protein
MCNGQETPWMGKKTFFLKWNKVQGFQVGIKTKKEGWSFKWESKRMKTPENVQYSKEGIFQIELSFWVQES